MRLFGRKSCEELYRIKTVDIIKGSDNLPLDENLGILISDFLKIPFVVLAKTTIPADIFNIIPEKIARKKLLVGGIPKRLIDFAGNFKTVLFGPWDIDLVTGSPPLRRKFLDTVLSQVDREYRLATS